MTHAQLNGLKPAATIIERVFYCAFVFHLVFAALSFALQFAGTETTQPLWRGGLLFTFLALLSWIGARRIRRYKESLA